jgi:acylpyruvate hydrolase
MRLVTFKYQGQERLGAQLIRENGIFILDLHTAQPALPADMLLFLHAGAATLELACETLACADAAALLPENDVTLLAPVPRPGKILCLGHNYLGHIGSGRTEKPEYPTIFSKTPNTVTGHGQPIVIPPVTGQVDFEAEMAVIIGQRGRNIPEAEAMNYVAGYSICNDVSARDYQKRTTQWMIGKSFDTFAPLGPALVTPDEVPDPYNLELSLTLNGIERQRTNTGNLIFSIAYLIAYLSAVMTLNPGDILMTGTPAKLPAAPDTASFMRSGDVVEITITKLGTLRNPVVDHR